MYRYWHSSEPGGGDYGPPMARELDEPAAPGPCHGRRPILCLQRPFRFLRWQLIHPFYAERQHSSTREIYCYRFDSLGMNFRRLSTTDPRFPRRASRPSAGELEVPKSFPKHVEDPSPDSARSAVTAGVVLLLSVRKRSEAKRPLQVARNVRDHDATCLCRAPGERRDGIPAGRADALAHAVHARGADAAAHVVSPEHGDRRPGGDRHVHDV